MEWCWLQGINRKLGPIGEFKGWDCTKGRLILKKEDGQVVCIEGFERPKEELGSNSYSNSID